jgi:hypothetical protein
MAEATCTADRLPLKESGAARMHRGFDFKEAAMDDLDKGYSQFKVNLEQDFMNQAVLKIPVHPPNHRAE